MTPPQGRGDPAPCPQPHRERDRLGDGLWAATLIWIVGMATVFPLGNDALEAVSVFTFDRIAFLAVAALLVLVIARTPAMLHRWGRVEVMMALYLAVVVVSWTMTLPEKHAVDMKRDVDLLLTSFLMPYTAFVIARYCGWSRWQVRTAAWVIVAGVGAFLIAVGLVQGLIDWRFLVSEAHQAVHRSRARGSFPNALPYAVLLALLVPIALALRVHDARRTRRVLLVVLCAGLLEALLLSQIRIVWIALPAALLYCAAVCPPTRRAAVLSGVALLTAIALASGGMDLRLISRADGALVQLPGGVGQRMVDSWPVYDRVAVYATALNMIAHRPLLGFGFGTRTFERWRGAYLTSCCGVSPDYAAECAVPHNELLNVLVLLGAVGLAAYLGLLRELWRLLSAGRAAPADPDRAILAAGVQTGFVLLVITAQLHDVMYLSSVQVLFFFFVGLVAPLAIGAGERAAAAPGERGSR